MTKFIAIAVIGVTLIAGCSQTTQTSGAGVSFGSQYDDATAKVWPPKRHANGGRG